MKQSYKQSFALLCITLLASQSVFGIMTKPSRVAGVHPKHRRLSQMGMLDLSIDGRGYFAFALRVKAPGADAGNDESMATPGSADYDSAYGTGAPGPANTAASSGMQADGAKVSMCSYTAKVDEACAKTAAAAAAGTCAINNANGCDYDADGAGDVSSPASDDGTNCDYTAGVVDTCKDSLGQVDSLCTPHVETAESCAPGEGQVEPSGADTCNVDANKVLGTAADVATAQAACIAAQDGGTTANGGDGTGAADCVYTAAVTAAEAAVSCPATKDSIPATGAENNDGSDTGHYLQVVYSRDGSLHINRYGFLVDDNGLLLLGAAAKSNSDPTDEDATSLAKEAIHIPSRTDEIIVTTTGKVISKTDGAVFTQVGQLKLTRFANPMGLNVRLNMRSRCSSMNEIGFSLGNWCSGTPLDGKAHEYLVETEVSGAGEIANPGDSGFGNIVQ
tara:strand:- start:195 stop:1538 length:1344 start_codon:yes stop_codon:yes gene_type:complete